MKTYRNETLGFEVDMPDEWALPKWGSSHTPAGELIAFGCNYFEEFNISIHRLNKEPTLEQVKGDLKQIVQSQKYYSNLEFGNFFVAGREQIWVRYYLGGGRWNKKYIIVTPGMQYVITATCFYDNRLLDREKVWDLAVKSFRMLSSQPGYGGDEAVTYTETYLHGTSTLQKEIEDARRDNPQLTANMTDEEIFVLLQQADLTMSYGKPMTFHIPIQKDNQPTDLPDLLKMSARECGVRGEQLFIEGRWAEAEKYFYAQLDYSRRNADLDQQATAYSSLGNLYLHRGDVAQAKILYNEALTVAEQNNNQYLCGIIYNLIGELLRIQGDYSQAILWYEKSLAIAIRMGNPQELAVVHGNLGIVYKNLGNFEQAERAYKKSLKYSMDQGLDNLTANQYGNIGVLYGLQGQYDLAIEMHKKSLEICLRLGLQKNAANTYGNLGLVQLELGNYMAAKEMYTKALEIMQRLGDVPGIALTYNNFGILYQRSGNTSQSIVYYEEAIKIFLQIDDKHNLARTHNNLGLLYCDQGMSAKSRMHLEKARTYFGEMGDEQNVWKVTQELFRL